MTYFNNHNINYKTRYFYALFYSIIELTVNKIESLIDL